MTKPETAFPFLVGEVDALEAFDFVAVAPSGEPLHLVEVTRLEAGGLEVRVPGRPRTVPALDAGIRSKLLERDFSADDPANALQPWVRVVPTSTVAVEVLQELLVEVFGQKPDVALDIGHGSHRAEHEARQKMEIARSRIGTIVADLLGQSPEQDDDLDYVLPIGEVHVMVAPRANPDGQVVIRIFAITNVGVTVAPELGLFLARLNFGLMFGRFALDVEHKSIWFDETLLGEQFREEELRFAIRVVASTADEWDDRLKQMFGGATYQEVLAGRSAEGPPPIKPGEGVGQYL